ncbi:hypothetical protein [Streptomyces sp. NPDC014006]
MLHRLSATRTVIEPPGVDTTSGLWGVIDNPARSYTGCVRVVNDQLP